MRSAAPVAGPARAALALGLASLKPARRSPSADIPIAASFFDSERIAYSNISEEW